MDEKNKNEQKNELKNVRSQEPEKYEGKTYAFIAIGLIAVGAVWLGVSFTKLGLYALIASMLFEITAMTFINLQKNKNNLKWLIYLKIAAYALFIFSAVLFVGGTIWSSQE